MSNRVEKTEEEWKMELTPEQFWVLRQKGTERAWTGKYLDNKQKGVYSCAGCKTPLFTSEAKYNSGCGWPSFFTGIEENIKTEEDRSYGMVRIEILCKVCDGHLGHVFDDGPPPTGLRYCVNSLSVEFERS